MGVDYLRWMAKLNYETEGYGTRELMEIGKNIARDVTGVGCTWLHPPINSTYIERVFTFFDIFY